MPCLRRFAFHMGRWNAEVGAAYVAWSLSGATGRCLFVFACSVGFTRSLHPATVESEGLSMYLHEN